MANAGDDAIIPPNASQVLFAEDLVNFVLYHQNGMEPQTWRSRDCRDFVHTGFDEDVQRAVRYIMQLLEWRTDQQFSDMVDRHAVNIETFVDHARLLQVEAFQYGLEPEDFLLYCVDLASLASYLAVYHVTDAVDACVDYILAAFPEHDMHLGGWEAIKNAARRFGMLSGDLNNQLTPETSDSDSGEWSDESQDEGERDVYPLRRVELEINQSEESSPLQKNDENEVHNSREDENDLNHSAKSKVPSGGNPDRNCSEDETEGAFAQMLHNEGFCPNSTKGSPSKNTFKQENPQFDGRSVQSTSRCSKLLQFDCCKTENCDLDKHKEEIDCREINQENINFSIHKLQKLANQERKDEQAECALKCAKSVDVGVSCFEVGESSGEISNLRKNGEEITEGALPIESRLLTESRQLITHDAPNKNMNCASRDAENCSEGVDFTKTEESSPKTILPKSVVTLHEQECLSAQNNELKVANLRCSSPEINCKTCDSVGG